MLKQIIYSALLLVLTLTSFTTQAVLIPNHHGHPFPDSDMHPRNSHHRQNHRHIRNHYHVREYTQFKHVPTANQCLRVKNGTNQIIKVC